MLPVDTAACCIVAFQSASGSVWAISFSTPCSACIIWKTLGRYVCHQSPGKPAIPAYLYQHVLQHLKSLV